MTTGNNHGSSHYMVTLRGCSHQITFQRAYLPDVGEEIWCVLCGKYRSVFLVAGMYRTECSCNRFTRYFGAAKYSAQRAADRHSRKFAGHCVRVWLGDEFVSTHVSPPQPTLAGNLDGTLDLPPF